MTWSAFLLFYVFTIGWGGRQAAGCVAREIDQKTWDWQRLSTQKPWALTWGKFFGATSFTWACAGLCLIVFLVAGHFSSNFKNPGATAVLMIVLSLFCQGLGLLFSLLGTGGRGGQQAGNVTLAHLGAIVVTIVLYYLSTLQTLLPGAWYGIFDDLRWFRILSFAFFGGWIMVGVYRQMRRILQVPNNPWVWWLFLITYVLYAMGLFAESRFYALHLVLPVWLVTMFVYPLVMAERKDPVMGAWIMAQLRRGRLISAVGRMPLWGQTFVLSWILALISFGVSFAVAFDYIPITTKLPTYGGFLNLDRLLDMVTLVLTTAANGDIIRLHLIAVALFLSRDVLLVLVFAYGRNSDGAGTYGFIFWFLLYVPIPIVLIGLGLTPVYSIFFAVAIDGWAWQLLPVGLSVAVLLAVLILRWRAYLAWNKRGRGAA